MSGVIGLGPLDEKEAAKGAMVFTISSLTKIVASG